MREYEKQEAFLILKRKKKNYDRDVFGASLLGIVKVYESYFFLLYMTMMCNGGAYRTRYSRTIGIFCILDG